jgi:hypothetical protein
MRILKRLGTEREGRKEKGEKRGSEDSVHGGDEERDAGLKPGHYKGKGGGLKTRRYEGAAGRWKQRRDEEKRSKGRRASFGLQTRGMIAWFVITVKL